MRHICPPCKKTLVRLVLDQECNRLGISEYGGLGKWSYHEIPVEACRILLSFLLMIVRLRYGRHAKGLKLRELDLSLELWPASTQGCDAPECYARRG